MQSYKWTTETISEQIKSVMESLNIDRMPSGSEMAKVRGSSDLSNIISKRGGFYHWAKELGIEVKKSETSTGKGYEEIAESQLIDRGFSVKRMTTKHPYDLLVNDHIKVDVKVSKAYWLKGQSLVNTVGLGKMYATCDIYLIYLLDELGDLDRTLVIPGHDVKHKYLNIGKESKYNVYVDRWNYFDAYNKLFEMLNE